MMRAGRFLVYSIGIVTGESGGVLSRFKYMKTGFPQGESGVLITFSIVLSQNRRFRNNNRR